MKFSGCLVVRDLGCLVCLVLIHGIEFWRGVFFERRWGQWGRLGLGRVGGLVLVRFGSAFLPWWDNWMGIGRKDGLKYMIL